MELWTAFMLGLAGSLHCAGMCGPLLLAMPVAAGHPLSALAGRLVYHGGRLTVYASLGLAFGLVGGLLGLVGVQRWVSICAGALLLGGLIAGSSARINTWLAAPTVRLRAAFATALRQRTIGTQFVLGGLNGLLPCGLVYVACAGAVSRGNVLAGLEYMVAFGAGTLPMMLGIQYAGKLLQGGLRVRFQRVAPVCVGIMAMLLILRGLGLGIPYLSPVLSAASGAGCCHPLP
jgi:sulfite exporter TauE/SafE